MRRTTLIAALALAVIAAGCSDGPTGPELPHGVDSVREWEGQVRGPGSYPVPLTWPPRRAVTVAADAWASDDWRPIPTLFDVADDEVYQTAAVVTEAARSVRLCNADGRYRVRVFIMELGAD